MRKIELEIGDFIPPHTLEFVLVPGSTIKTGLDNDEFSIVADSGGLRQLATYLLLLAETDVPCGYHLHLDDSNGLEPGSPPLRIEKM